MNYTIPQLAANTGLATNTLLEQWNVAAGGKSQQFSLAQLITFLSTNFTNLSISGSYVGQSALIGGNNIHLNSDGSASFGNGTASIDAAGNITANQFILGSGFGELAADGSATLANGNFVVMTTGQVILTGADSMGGPALQITDTVGGSNYIQMDSNFYSAYALLGVMDGDAFFQYGGNATGFRIEQGGGALGELDCANVNVNDGVSFLNNDGSVVFSSGDFTVDVDGNVACHQIQLFGSNFITSAGFASLGNGFFTVDVSGNIVGLTATIGPVTINNNGSVTGLVVTTSNTTATATFNTAGRSETIYDNSASTIASLAINLPATTVAGQILRYVTKGVATIVTVSGTVSIGAAVTTLAANASIAYQAVDTAGTFIRIQ